MAEFQAVEAFHGGLDLIGGTERLSVYWGDWMPATYDETSKEETIEEAMSKEENFEEETSKEEISDGIIHENHPH